MLERLASLDKEIEVSDIVRFTKKGLDNCEGYDPTFQWDLNEWYFIQTELYIGIKHV